MKAIEKSGSHYLWTGPLDWRVRCMTEAIDRQGRKRYVMVYRPIWTEYWDVSLEQFGLDTRTLKLKRVCTVLRCVAPQHYIIQKPDSAWKKYGYNKGQRRAVRKAFMDEGLSGSRCGVWWDISRVDEDGFSPPHEIVVALSAKLDVPIVLILAAWSELVRTSMKMSGVWTRKDRAVLAYEKANGVKIR